MFPYPFTVVDFAFDPHNLRYDCLGASGYTETVVRGWIRLKLSLQGKKGRVIQYLIPRAVREEHLGVVVAQLAGASISPNPKFDGSSFKLQAKRGTPPIGKR